MEVIFFGAGCDSLLSPLAIANASLYCKRSRDQVTTGSEAVPVAQY